LKPANILLDTHGQPHLTDFGLAKRLDADFDITLSGEILGTASYLAPEQTEGKQVFSTYGDVYSLGATLYELLTGRPASQGRNLVKTLLTVREREPQPLRELNRQVDADLQTICLKCLRKDPEARYDSAAAFADDLERWLAGEPIQARPTSKRQHVGVGAGGILARHFL